MLPSGWIDKLFERFAFMYGKAWADQWSGIPVDKVKQAWSEDLARFDGECLRKALEHCKSHNKFPPSCPEFVGLCLAMRPAQSTYKAISGPRQERDPKITAAIAEFLNPSRKVDPKDWARKILAEHEAGTFNNLHSITVAKQALGILPL